MKILGRSFPWKIGLRFFLNQFVFSFAVTIFVGFSIRYTAYRLFSSTADVHQALGDFDAYLTKLVFLVLLIVCLFHAWTTRVFFKPLGRLVGRARELRRASKTMSFEASFEQDSGIEEPGEWHDLERALNRIHRDLKRQTTALARESEELSALIGAVSDAILAVDQSGEVLFYNSPFALAFKSKRATNLSEIFRTPEVLEAYRDVLKSGIKQSIDCSLPLSSQTALRHFSVAIAPLRLEEQGSVYGAVGVFHDVTELKQAEQIRIEFVANASHELRTPLTSIKGYMLTLKQDVAERRFDGTEKFFDIILRNVERLTFLVSDLLDLSTIESGAEFKRQLVDTRDLTEAVFRSLEARKIAKNQQLLSEFTTDTVMGDPHRIEQVLVNLVVNAIKYTPEGSRIDVIWTKDPTGGTLLKVRDNGPGIPFEHQDRLFERFYRIDPGRSREQGGTGLGLSIVKHIMLKHGGSIRVVSASAAPNAGGGRGSEFICRFPDVRPTSTP